jgi:phosphate transport system substrate-binding protein
MRTIAFALVLGVLAGCERTESDGPAASATIRVDGSSTVYLISESQANAFKRAGLGEVALGESGTSGGFRKFCAGRIDVSGASRPINRAEIRTCDEAGIEFIELPVGYDGMAVVVNPRNTWVDHLTVAELKAIWEPGSRISSWRQVREKFPDRPMKLFGPGADSGTFDYFTLAINGRERASRTDYTGSEDDNVLARGVAGDENALGYFGYAYYVENWDKLKLLAVDDGVAANGDGPLPPSQETVSSGTYQPLSRPIFIYVSMTSLRRSEVARFVKFYLDHARKAVSDAGYVALPDRGDELVKARYEARKTGTAFTGGSQVGVTIEKLYAAESR